jgi:hypothetical protein
MYGSNSNGTNQSVPPTEPKTYRFVQLATAETNHPSIRLINTNGTHTQVHNRRTRRESILSRDACRRDLRRDRAMERAVPHRASESYGSSQHTVHTVGLGLRTDGRSKRDRQSFVVSGWMIRSLFVCQDRMWTMGRHVAWSAFASSGSVLVNYSGTLSVPRLQ